MYHEDSNDIILNRQDIDRTYTVSNNDRLNEFENWLHCGAIDAQSAQNVLNKFYEQMPF
ncbi:hypothetical protein [Actinobacillus porcinus]|uniref:hypothetical protein n=1 Tax=Actinobacillus porcinus TaxID=51048 RepID=UPI0023EFCEB8|nr:hypothetical protein [Actinobacillus porcinus]MDD7545614.1 hypothetical protein [Actinobacillus porcinus]MDY5847593.1 hypothetical protein [Actinobacillus porcinus]